MKRLRDLLKAIVSGRLSDQSQVCVTPGPTFSLLTNATLSVTGHSLSGAQRRLNYPATGAIARLRGLPLNAGVTPFTHEMMAEPR